RKELFNEIQHQKASQITPIFNVDRPLVIQLEPGQLAIENTGPPLRQAPELLFERFCKERKSAESMRLGLATIREVCDKYGYHLRYTNESERHRVVVDF
ncbi:MAG: hypothetical protein OTI34_12215, partial [Lewinella sp.]|nr:hypothetical protein [Lewinella sp.]